MATVIGLMADPGLPMDLARKLNHEPPTDSEGWRYVLASEKLPLDRDGEIPLARFAQHLGRNREWDYAIYITELPIWREGAPVRFEINHEGRAALVSLPSLGILQLRNRLQNLLDEITRAMLDGAEPRGTVTTRHHQLRHDSSLERAEYMLASGVLGRLQLLVGMVRSNRPGRLITAMSNSIATAIATGAFGIFYASIWNLADALHPARLAGISLLVSGALTAWLIAHNGLWNTTGLVPDAGRRRRDNAATTVTISISVLIMHILLFLAMFAAALIIIDSGFLEDQLGHTVTITAYLRLSLLASSLGMLAGAVGSNFDSEDAIREATYSRREAERRRMFDERHRENE